MNKYFMKILIIIVCLISSISAAVIYVDNNLADGFWQGAYSSLQNAISVAQSGDEIWVAQGTYTPGFERDDSFVLKSGVKIYGGFFGGEISLNDRNPQEQSTILSGEIGISDNVTDNCYHVISYSGVLSNETVLDGFIVRDGNATDGKGGGGLLLENGAAPIIKECRFVQNQSSVEGGAVSVQNAVVFENCLFEANTAEQGGAVACLENRTQEGISVFDHCTFVKNIATSGSALYYGKRESAMVDSCVFWMNTDGSSNLNSLSLNTRVSSSSVSNSAFDDGAITAVTVSNLIYYISSEENGPFANTEDYLLDNNHAIPREWGWYYVQAPLVLNIRVFLQGAF